MSEHTEPYRRVAAILHSAHTMLEEAIRQCHGIPDRKILVSQIDASIAQAKAARAQAIALFQQRQRDQSHALGMAGAVTAQNIAPTLLPQSRADETSTRNEFPPGLHAAAE